jgi:hypothetical protein
VRLSNLSVSSNSAMLMASLNSLYPELSTDIKVFVQRLLEEEGPICVS